MDIFHFEMQKGDFGGLGFRQPRYDFSFIKPADIENLNEMSSFAAVSRFFYYLHRPKQQQVEIASETVENGSRAQCVSDYFTSILARRSKSATFLHDARNRCSRGGNPATRDKKYLPVQLQANLLVYTTVSRPKREQTSFLQQQLGIRLRRRRGAYIMENDYI